MSRMKAAKKDINTDKGPIWLFFTYSPMFAKQLHNSEKKNSETSCFVKYLEDLLFQIKGKSFDLRAFFLRHTMRSAYEMILPFERKITS